MAQYVLSNVTPTGRTLKTENRTITDIRWKPAGIGIPSSPEYSNFCPRSQLSW